MPRAYEAGDKTVREIALMFRITEATVVGYLDAKVRDRRLHDVRVLHERGVGRVEIGRELKLSPDTVSDYLRDLQDDGEIESAACPHCGR